MLPSPLLSLPPTPKRVTSTISLVFFALILCSSTAFNAVPSSPTLRNHHVSPATKKSSIRPNTAAATVSKNGFMSLLSSSNNDSMNDSMPSQDEIAQQKSAAFNALSSFHETSSLTAATSSDQIKSLLEGLDIGMEGEEQIKPDHWMCEQGAIAYAVPMDPAAGLKRGKVSRPYKASVQVEMDMGQLAGGAKRRGLRLVESIQFGNDALSIPFVRSIPLGENVDVDAVDGSYSLDDATVATTDDSPPLPLMPPSLLAGVVDPMAVQFVVEHTLAVSETERSRCFLLYGGDDAGGNGDIGYDDEDVDEEDFAIVAARKARKESDATERKYRLLGVVLAEEIKVMPKQDSEDDASDSISELIESSTSPLDLLEVNQPLDESKDEKMDRLMQSFDKHNKQVMEEGINEYNNQNKKMEQHALGMFGLTSGVWLGDTFVRESIPTALSRARQSRQTKGFGKNTKTNDDENAEEDRFATWQMGVQKVALLFRWDYSKSISQDYTYGKVLGTATSFSSMANIKSDGIVVVDEGRKTKKREERRVIWDMDGGSYVAGLIGSSYFRAPRYMSFSQSRNYSADAYLTEFMAFYRPENGDVASPDGGMEDDVAPMYYCSRAARLYNAKNGNLMQGSTAFFSLSPLEQSD